MENRIPGKQLRSSSSNDPVATNKRNSKDENESSAMNSSIENGETRHGSPDTANGTREPEQEPEQHQQWWKKIWKSLGLDLPTALMMFK